MCDVNTANILENIVRTNVSGRTMFTSFDVSREAQQNHGVRERHQNMKNEPHKLFGSGVMADYRRVTITLPGVPVDPWLYYPPESDPANYVSPHTGQTPTAVGGIPVTKAVTSTVVQQATPPALPASTDDEDDDEDTAAAQQADDGQPKADRRGRCWVPAKLITGLGLKPGDVAYVTRTTFASHPALKVTANLDPTATEAVAYKVDRHSNIAISKGCLEEADIDAPSGTGFDLAGDFGCVIVQLASNVVTAGV